MPPDGPPLVVSGSLPCIRCAYDLDHASLDSVCPECATPIAESSKSLYLADAEDIRQLRRGLIMLALVSSVGPLIYIVSAISLAVTASSANPLGCVILLMWVGPIVAMFGLHQFISSPSARALPTSALHPYAMALGTAYLVSFLAVTGMALVRANDNYEVHWKVAAAFGALAWVSWCLRNVIILAYLHRIAAVANMRRRSAAASILQLAALCLGAVGVVFVSYLLMEQWPDYSVRYVFMWILVLMSIAWFIAWPVFLFSSIRGLSRVLASQSRRGQPHLIPADPPGSPPSDPASAAPPTS